MNVTEQSARLSPRHPKAAGAPLLLALVSHTAAEQRPAEGLGHTMTSFCTCYSSHLPFQPQLWICLRKAISSFQLSSRFHVKANRYAVPPSPC